MATKTVAVPLTKCYMPDARYMLNVRLKEAQRKSGRVAGATASYRSCRHALRAKLCPLPRRNGKRMKDHAGARYTKFHDERDNLAMISLPTKT